jgi:thiamine transport system permease protein
VALFTIKQASLSALAALALGLPGAWLAGTSDSKAAGALRALSAVPFAMPSIIVVLGFVLFFGNAGWANRILRGLSGKTAGDGPIHLLYQPAALVAAHAFYNFPLVVRLVGDSLVRTRRAYAPVAASLGASPLVSALTVFFPAALPALINAALLAFLYSFTSFSIVLVLGGGPAATTLAVEIYRYARVLLLYREAGIFALVESGVVCLVFTLYLFMEKKTRTHAPDAVYRPFETRKPSLFNSIPLFFYIIALVVLVAGPLLSVIAESFLSRASRAGGVRIDFRWWLNIGERSAAALGRSLFLAALSATTSCCLAVMAAFAALHFERRTGDSYRSTLIRLAATLPLASSGIVLGLGFLIIYGRKGTIMGLVALHAVTALPFAFSAIRGGFQSLNPAVLNAAESLGAGPLTRLLTIDLPLSARSLRSAWGFAAALSLGELNALMMIGLEDFETLPLLIYRAAGAYRYGAACAAGALLMLCCAAALMFSDWGRKE